MPSPPPRFVISAKIYFLTYPQCTLSKEEALSQIRNLFLAIPPRYIRVASEIHQEDGQPHLHVLLQFGGKFTCMNSRFFDLVSPTRSAHFHPNVRGASSSSEVQPWISKYGEYTDWGTFLVDGRLRGETRNEVYREALNSNSKRDALQIIKEKDPLTFYRRYRTLSTNLDRIFAPRTTPYQSAWSPESFIPTLQMVQWVNENIKAPADHQDRPMSLILEGPSRTGKTEWARSIGSHNYFCGHMDFRTYNNDAYYNVIDDIPPRILKEYYWKPLIGAKRDWQANTKGRPVLIKSNIPAIVLCNPGPSTSYKEFLDKKKNSGLRDWTLPLNALYITISSPLFSENHPD